MKKKNVDWGVTIIPLVTILGLAILFFGAPDKSNKVLEEVRCFFGDKMGFFYILIGIFFISTAIYLCTSKYGSIILGDASEKPKYTFFEWGSMMFTCGLAADILFYSFSEWIMYANNEHIEELGGIQQWACTFSLFHWSFIPWGFYLVLAVAFAFMLHVKKISKQRFSEAVRPLLGKYTDGILGKIIDLFSIFALLAGTATTFSVATPLMAAIIQNIFNLSISRTYITIAIIVLTCIVYTYSLLHGFKGISTLAKICIILFFGLLIIVFAIGGRGIYIIETGIESFGRMLQNFIGLATYTDPLRQTNFAQDWTIYYWAYWMVWCIAAPFFIGSISKGRTVREVIAGGFIFGVGSTILSFVILGNYSLGVYMSGTYDAVSEYTVTGDLYGVIIKIINTIPGDTIILIWVLVTMIAFYATSFDSIAYTASCYSCVNLDKDKNPDKRLQLIWCILLIVLPIALVFSESSMNNIQTVSIIAAFPLGIIMILIVCSFFKDARKYCK